MTIMNWSLYIYIDVGNIFACCDGNGGRSVSESTSMTGGTIDIQLSEISHNLESFVNCPG